MPKLVSIVLPTYNRAALLPGAIESCLRQTYEELEVIVVDDGSTDGTPEVVSAFERQDSRVRYLRQANQKLPAALNTGFRVSRGEFLTWSSDDNRFHPDAIQIMAEALEHSPDVGLVYCGYELVDAEGNVLQRIRVPGPETLAVVDNVFCFLYRRVVYEVIGEYDPHWLYVEDYDYWLRIQKKFKIAYLPDVYPYSYMTHPGSLGSQLGSPFQKALTARLQIHHASSWIGKLRILSGAPAQVAEAYARQGDGGRAVFGCLLYILFKPWRGYRWRRALEILRPTASPVPRPSAS